MIVIIPDRGDYRGKKVVKDWGYLLPVRMRIGGIMVSNRINEFDLFVVKNNVKDDNNKKRNK